MVHSSRRNYKSKLISKGDDVVEAGVTGSTNADKVYDFIEHENIAKKQLSNEIIIAGEIGIDLVKKLDETRNIGRLKFAECQEVNDDVIGKKSAFDIIDRLIDIILAAEERIDVYAEHVTSLESSESGMRKKLATIEDKMEEARTLQHELYNVGKGATESEIQAFRNAEKAGEKFHRFQSDQSQANIRQAPPTPPITPEQVITPRIETPSPASVKAQVPKKVAGKK